MENYGNIITNIGAVTLPSYKPADVVAGSWSDDQNFQAAFADGWRHILDRQAPQEGYRVTQWGYTEAGGVYCHEVILAATNIADAQAAARAARIAMLVELITKAEKWPEAADYRMTMRAEFGEGAETNVSLGMDEVFAHFEQLRLSQTITTAQQAAALALLTMYQDLSPYCVTPADMRTFPWSYLPA